MSIELVWASLISIYLVLASLISTYQVLASQWQFCLAPETKALAAETWGGGGAGREQQATEYCIMFTLDTVYLERMPDWRWLMGKTWMAPRGLGCGVDRPWNNR